MTAWSDADIGFMREALGEARVAAEANEVPVGAVVVYGGEIIARAMNRSVSDCDPTAHAEVVALRAAAQAVGNHRLQGATLFVTLEPCPMCVGAMTQARIDRLVFGAYDDKAGGLGGAVDLTESPALNHRFEINGGVLRADSEQLLKQFFEARR
ncbi:MAG: tRNA adenosine(34) deaminase TadA [Pseudomonadota bacterium]